LKAVKTKNNQLVEYLIENGVDLRQVNIFTCNIFHVAAKHSTASIIRLLADSFKGLKVSKI
jgi:hypothetical protein